MSRSVRTVPAPESVTSRPPEKIITFALLLGTLHDAALHTTPLYTLQRCCTHYTMTAAAAMAHVQLSEGQEFSSLQAFKEAVIRWAVVDEFEVILQKSDRERAVYRCRTATKDCGFVVSAW